MVHGNGGWSIGGIAECLGQPFLTLGVEEAAMAAGEQGIQADYSKLGQVDDPAEVGVVGGPRHVEGRSKGLPHIVVPGKGEERDFERSQNVDKEAHLLRRAVVGQVAGGQNRLRPNGFSVQGFHRQLKPVVVVDVEFSLGVGPDNMGIGQLCNQQSSPS